MENLIDVAKGNTPADLLLKGARVVNVFSGEILTTNIAVKDGLIAGLGDYRQGLEVLNLAGKYVIPGLIDAHFHIESSMLTPSAFAAVAVPHGTTAVVADPHEIVNVSGLEGFRFMVEASRGLPLDIFYMVPSCVPATPLETSGAEISPEDLRQAMALHPRSPGLAEFMNFPGVCSKSPDVLAKIRTALEHGCLIDGHSPLLGGRDLNAYLSTGILTDHECTSAAEALEKMRLGMRIIIREGSAAKNLAALLPIVTDHNYQNIFFCCDDRHPADLMAEGQIDHVLRKAVGSGLDPVRAVQMATLHPARHYNLRGLGGIAPGYQADLLVVSDLSSFRIELVFKAGKLAARQGRYLWLQTGKHAESASNTVHLPELQGRLSLEKPAQNAGARVIEVQPEQILTKCLIIPAAEIDASDELARVAVVERHGKNGNIAVGLVKGFGRLKGALASTVAHDSHNLILVGTDTQDMELAARTVAAAGGGLAVVSEGRVLASLALPVAGLMSNEDADTVSRLHEELHRAAQRIGCSLPSPFMTMSFLALPVIPELRITDFGLVDVTKFEIVDLWKQK
jgi:adenine deaminase